MSKPTPLHLRHCEPRRGQQHALDAARIEALLTEVPNWKWDREHMRISRTFAFADYHRTMAFVNALAYVAHAEDHHPDLEVGYAYCTAHFSTHDAGGISENDFICAAQLDVLAERGR